MFPKIEDFEYDLPPELIAQQPLSVRHQSRLLLLGRRDGSIGHKQFSDIAAILVKGDVLVVNDTKVIPARLHCRRKSGGTIKLLLLKPVTPQSGIWEALVTPIKRLKEGETLTAETLTGEERQIKVAGISIGPDNFKRLLVDLGEPAQVFDLLSKVGYAPLPPYIVRERGSNHGDCEDGGAHKLDLERYQTVFARQPGAVAAPTAGLHFSGQLLETLEKKGVEICYVTLHVGAGTFKPISDSVDEHTIEPEEYHLSAATQARLNQAKEDRRRIIAVGTTSLRVLESAVQDERFQVVAGGVTNLYVKPGHQFKAVDGLVTNFHLSRSSLLVLVAAFAGRENVMNAYQEAIKARYRFFSYGDAMLII